MNAELKTKIEAGMGEYRKSGKRWAMTSEEIREALAAGWKDLRGADLMGADLRGAYLTGAHLRGACLWGACLWGAYLWGADLMGADLRGAYLTGADLMGADLRGAKIDDDKIITGYFTRTRIGSDNAELQIAYNDADIWIKRGCSGWLTPDKFLARVDETHGDRLHGQIYRLTIKHICEVVELERAIKEAKRG